MTSSPNQRRGGNYELDVHENRDEMKFLAGAATNARPHPNLRFLLPKAHLWGPAKDERRGKAMKGEGSEPMRALRARQGTVRCVCRGVMDFRPTRRTLEERFLRRCSRASFDEDMMAAS